jgi:hypothetical protein
MTKGVRKRRMRVEAHRRLLGTAPLIVGLDLARSFHVAAFLERDGTPVCRSLRIPHCRAGVERLVGYAEKVRREHNLEKAIFFMESTGAHWMNVAGVLEEYGVAYRLVHGIAVRNARKMRDYTCAKDDLRDAEIVGHLGSMGRVVASQLPAERLWIELGGLAVERYELVRHSISSLQPGEVVPAGGGFSPIMRGPVVGFTHHRTLNRLDENRFLSGGFCHTCLSPHGFCSLVQHLQISMIAEYTIAPPASHFLDETRFREFGHDLGNRIGRQPRLVASHRD